MSTFIIAIGGTGAKLLEAIVHLGAAGIFASDSQKDLPPKDLHILFVDPDTGNGNLTAADSIALAHYQKCSDTIIGGINREFHSWMQTKIEKLGTGLWSPFQESGKTRSLIDAFNYDNYEPDSPLRHLFNVLYTQEEQKINLREGFRGRPAIGAAIMSKFIQEESNQKSWKDLIGKIQAGDQVFLCGSIFGGTGASGFPTLGRLLAEDLGEKGKNILDTVKLGGLLMLPYFKFDPPTEKKEKTNEKQEEEIYARSEEFILRTEAALRYYGAQNLKFDTVYLLGIPNPTKIQGSPKTGGSGQRNPPHFLELYGALALRDFVFSEKPEQLRVVYLSRNSSNSVTWEDIPERSEVRSKLINTTRFAFAWLSVIVPDLDHAKEAPGDVRWALRFFHREQLRQLNNESHEENDKIKAISAWCQDYLQWLLSLHQSESGVQWFNFSAFGSLDKDKNLKLKLDRNQFPNLVKEGGGSHVTKILENLDAKNINSENQGVLGLAKSLYRTICKTP
jgi:hypothetical protein